MSPEESTRINSLPSTAARRVLLGLGSAGLAQVLAAAYSFALTPLFLSAWGADGYGRWLTLTAISAFLVLLDFGSQNYLGNLMAQASVHQDIARLRQIFSEGLSLIGGLAIGVFLLLVAWLVTPWFSFSDSLALTAEERVVFLCLAANILLGVPGGLLAGLYRATGHLARGTMIGNATRLIGLLAMIVLLLMHQSPITLAGVILLTGILCTVGLILGHPNKNVIFRDLHLGIRSSKQGLRYLNGSLHFWLFSLAVMINSQGVLLILNAFLSPASIAAYSTTRAATGLVTYVGSFLQAPILPELTFLHAQNRQQELRHSFLLLVKGITILAGLAALAGWILLPHIYPVWTGQQLPLNKGLLAILLFQAVLSLGWNTSGWVLLAVNQHHRPAWWGLANAGITLGLSGLLVPSFGLIGAAGASLVGDIVCGLLVIPALSSDLLNIPHGRFYRAILIPVLVFTTAGALYTILAEWNGLRFGSAAGGLVAAVLVVYLIKLSFNPEEKAWLQGRITAGLRSKQPA